MLLPMKCFHQTQKMTKSKQLMAPKKQTWQNSGCAYCFCRNYNPKEGRGSKKPVSREEAMQELLDVVRSLGKKILCMVQHIQTRKQANQSDESQIYQLILQIKSTKPDNFTPRIVEKKDDYVRVEYESPIFGVSSASINATQDHLYHPLFHFLLQYMQVVQAIRTAFMHTVVFSIIPIDFESWTRTKAYSISSLQMMWSSGFHQEINHWYSIDQHLAWEISTLMPIEKELR